MFMAYVQPPLSALNINQCFNFVPWHVSHQWVLSAFSKWLCSSHCIYHVLMPCGDVPVLNILIPRAAKRKCWFWGRLCKPQTCQCTLGEVLTDFNEPTLLTIPPFPRNSCSLCPPPGATCWWIQRELRAVPAVSDTWQEFMHLHSSSCNNQVPQTVVSLRIINKRWWTNALQITV